MLNDNFRDLVMSLVSLDESTGILTWTKRRRSKKDIGRSVGCVARDGYVQVSICNKKYKAHRLIWLIKYGELPDLDIDHINGDRTDNRPENLRLLSRSMNLQNSIKPHRNNKCGFLGVSPNGARWSASIRHQEKKVHIGTFDTPEMAHKAYLEAKVRLHQGFNASRLE